ncbi:MAG: hypothetical protein WD689_03210 [Gaiellaceae bacterium]
MIHHADFAVAIPQRLWLVTRVDRPRGSGRIAGRAIALGWWVEKPGSPPSDEAPTGTLYLIADEELPRPVWVAQGDVVELRFD